jgi:hypothetical protein
MIKKREKEKKKTGVESQMGADTKTDWLTDCRS